MTRTRRTAAPTVPLAERIRSALAQGWHTLAVLDDLTGLRGSKARAAVHDALREIRESGAVIEEQMGAGGVEVRIVMLPAPKPDDGSGEREPAAADECAAWSDGIPALSPYATEVLADLIEHPPAPTEALRALYGTLKAADPVRVVAEDGSPGNAGTEPVYAAAPDAASEAERLVPREPGPTSRCAVCDAQYRAHDIIDLGHPFTPKPRGRPRVRPIPDAAPAILPRAKQRKTPGPIVDVAAGRIERAGDAEPTREPWPPCVDCGEPDSGTCPEGRCRDCDLEHIFTTGACRECHTFLMREEMGALPLAEQHVKGCTLATSDDWGVRNAAEYTATRAARYGWAPEPKRGCEREFPPVRVWPIVIAAQRPAERCHPPTCHADSIHEPARVRGFAYPLCEAHRAWVERAGGSVRYEAKGQA